MRLLIVDDEDYTREGLVDEINWKEYGIDEIMQAGDGNAALKIAKWFLPDIVLTDIRMPKKDGIEFATDLLHINADSILIFMSGYLEIEYLKRAIDLSAVAFVEKPISVQKVTEAIEKAILAANKKKRHKKLSVDNVELQKQKLVNILICKDNSREMVHRICDESSFPQNSNYNCLIIWDKDSFESREANANIIYSWFKKYNITCLCNDKESNHYVVILSYNNKDKKILDNIYLSFVKSYPKYTIGIGVPVSDIMNIYTSYSSAEAALNYSFYDENKRLFEIDDHLMKQATLDPGIYNEFFSIYKNTPYLLGDWFDKLVQHFIETKYYHKAQVNNLMKSFVLTILKDHVDLYDSLEGISCSADLDVSFEYAKSIFDINKILKDVVAGLIRKIDSISKYSKIVNDVVDYISKHYQDPDLSIQEIADIMHLSTTHLNVLFKQEKQITLKQYLSNIRNTKAKLLLENEHYNITEVAELCGYANANYFAKVFKENNYLTPLEYRKQRNV